MAILIEMAPLNPVTGERVTLRASSVDDRRVNALNDVRWWPAISSLPTLAIKLFDGDFSTAIDPGGASFTVLTDKLSRMDRNARKYLWAGAGVTIYSGVAGQAWPWTKVFVGVVDKFDQQANRNQIQCKIATEPFDKEVLYLKYAGTTGIEGGADLKNQTKPWIFGRALNVEPVLLDAVNSVYQFSAYGPILAVNALYERAGSFGASVGDYATFAALVAATIAPGRWATCLASGLVRLGAPPYGVITGDVDGDNFGGTWRRLTGAIIQRIATAVGVPVANIDVASLNALDVAVPYPVNIVITDQTTVLQLAQSMALPCNSQAGVSWLGQLFATRMVIGSPALTLDAQGRRNPQVSNSAESDVSPPYWRIAMGAQKSWRVHTAQEIAFNSLLVERGLFDIGESYREGHIVALLDGSRWLYTATTPSVGNTPPNVTYWASLNPATNVDFEDVSGGTKPADNATVGAPIGTPVGTITAGDVSGTIKPGGGIAPNNVNTVALLANSISKIVILRSGTTTYGNGTYQLLYTGSLTLDVAGFIYANFTGTHAYTGGLIAQIWNLRVKVDGVTISAVGGDGALTDAVSCSGAVAAAAGLHSITVEWLGTNSNLNLSNDTTYMQGLMK